MREIKFRAFNKKNKKMIYFDFNNIYGYEGETCGVILPDEHTELNFNSGYGDHGINKDLEIMQYTGLHDKNGNEIYEGDILKIPEWLMQDNQDKCICVYAEEHQTSEIIGFGLYIKDGYSGEYKILVSSDEWDEFEVIGNIYDNPELLEV